MRKSKPFKPSVFTTIIGDKTSLKGDIEFSQGMHVDGSITGNIHAEGDKATLTVSDKAHIQGDIHVANVVLNGRIEGNIHSSERVELAENARIKGKIHYNMLEMAMGAQVDGEMIRHSETEKDSDIDTGHEQTKS